MSKAIVSSLYDSDVFKMACRQFDKAADAINLPDALRDRTKYPRRCLAVALPVSTCCMRLTRTPYVSGFSMTSPRDCLCLST